MKKFALLLCVSMAALMVPQRVTADALLSDGGNTITITTTASGQVSGYISSLTSEQKAAIKTIVLSGKFNTSDLEAIQSSAGFSVVETVDMSEAKFVQATGGSSSANRKLFRSSASGSANIGDKAYVGGDLYQMSITSNSWESYSGDVPDGSTIIDYTTVAAMDADVGNRSPGVYARVPNETSIYWQMSLSNQSWSEITSPTDAQKSSASPLSCHENSMEGEYSNYVSGDIVKVRRYFHLGKAWTTEAVYPTQEELNNARAANNNIFNGAAQGATMGALEVNYFTKLGDYIWFYIYYQKQSDGNWTQISADPDAVAYDDILENELSSSSTLNSLPTDSKIKIRRYFKLVLKWDVDPENTSNYLRVYPTSEQLSSATHVFYAENYNNFDISNLAVLDWFAEGDYMAVWIYYQKNDSRIWTNCQTSLSEGTTYSEGNFAEADKDLSQNMRGYSNGDWVKMSAGYDYYVLKSASSTRKWYPVDYTDGTEYSISHYYSNTTNMENDKTNSSINNGDYALVGGTEYVYNGSEWVAAASATELYDYTQMKFSYWSSTLKHAVTSKYADTNIDGQIFDGCTELVTVDFQSGVVKGLSGKMKLETLNIGRGVSSIGSSSVEGSTLTQVTFDKDYSDNATPVELTIDNKAFYGCSNLEEIEFPNRVVSIGNEAFKEAGTSTTEFKVSFERRFTANGASVDFDRNLTIGESAFYGCSTIKELELPIRLTSLGHDSFKLTTGLKTMSIREDIADARLETIPSGAFQESGLETISIPRSVTSIETFAFGSCYDLQEIRFQEQIVESGQTQEPLVIEPQAFAGGDESRYKPIDVYLDINPVNRKLVCKYNAFSFTSLVGQTNVENSQKSTLHFSEEYWDYYQGNWKKGLAFRQDNLNAFKDGYNDSDKGYMGMSGSINDISTSTGKYDYTGEVSGGQYTPANGWQQFALTSTGVDVVIPAGSFIRTYSTNKIYEIPKENISGTMKYLVKVYRIIAFSDGYSEGKDINSATDAASASRSTMALLVKNTSDNEPCYIPKNTGLIMVGNVDSGSGYLTYFSEREANTNEPAYPYHKESDASTNLLAPTTGEGITSVVLNPTEPYPIWSNGTNENDNYRIFGMAKADYSDIGVSQYQFARMKPNQTMPENRAYLKLPVSMYHWARERMSTGPTYNDVSSSSRSISLLFSDEDIESTAIETPAVNSSSSEGYYTIQGVRVVRPQGKGLFIQNGKKIIVK